MMRIVAAHTRTERWSLDGSGAARGRTERIGAFLDLITADGRTFTGEAAPLPGLSPDSLDDALAALTSFAALAPFDVDTEPAALATRFAPHSPSARFAIETALLSVSTAHVSALHAMTLAPSVVVDDAADAARAAGAGARFLKLKVGPGLDRDRIASIARAAPNARLRLDANRSWPRSDTRAHLAALADLPIDYVEEPCVDAHELLAEPLAIPIALDESLVHLPTSALDLALVSPSLAALVLKPTLLGGFAACFELARRAAAHGKPVIVTHTLESPIGRAAVEAVAAALSASKTGDGPRFPAHRQVSVVVAHPTQATVDAIARAFAERAPIALLHPRAGEAELARQRAIVERAELRDGEAVVLFTSGSTGTPRGVVHTWASIAASIEASAAHFGWRNDDRWLLALSTAHAGGLSVVVRSLAAGKPIVRVEREGDRDALVAALAESTLASLVPTQLAMLLDDPAWRPAPALRAILLGGAAAPRALLDMAAARGVPFLTSYGLTETFGQVATAPLDRAGDASAPLVALGGVVLEAGTRDAPGPIRIRGPMLAARYLDDRAIAPAYTTADLGFLEAGALHVLGRADDVIITGGENVHPTQIEAALATTPGVRAACVFGVPDERWGQIVGVALAVDATFDEARAIAHWQLALASHARPRRLATCAALPLLPSGKVDRRAASTLPSRAVSYPRAERLHS